MRTKYRKGKRINTRAELLTKMDAGEWVFLMKDGHGKPLHPNFIHKYFEWIDRAIGEGKFFEAIEKRKGECTTDIHRSPFSHSPDWILNKSSTAYTCQYYGCKQRIETKGDNHV